MAHVAIPKPEQIDDPAIKEIFDWVTGVESAVPNHFYVELNFPEFLKAKLGATQVLWRDGELSMPEIQHVGILVSKANGCPYCTAAFCTILNYGLETPEQYVQSLVSDGIESCDKDPCKIAEALEKDGVDFTAHIVGFDLSEQCCHDCGR